MSAISLKSITGITSITTPAGVDNQLTLHNNNTTEAVKIDIAGNVHVNNHLAVSGVTTTTDNINIDADNKKLQIGDGQDLELFHNGTNSVINNTEGALLFQNNGSSSMYIGSDGQVYLNNDITFVGASANALWDKSENYFSIPDKIVHSGDTNTAIRFPANDTFTVELGGSERVRFGSSGEYDDISGSSDAGIIIGSGSFASAGIQIRTSATGTGRIYFGDNSGNDNGRKDGSIVYGQSSRSMQFATAQTERLRIKSDGSVRMGGSTASGFSAHVAADDLVVGGTSSHGMTILTGNATGSIFFNDGSGNDGVVQYVHSDNPNLMRIASSGDVRFDAGGSERLRINTNGQILISETSGTSGDGASLKFFFGNNNSTDVISSIYFANNVGTVASIKGETRNGNNYGMIRFNNQVNGVDGESMRLNHDGGFCVGTDSTRTAEFTTPDGFSVRSRDSSKGQFQVSVSGNTCGVLNRKSSSGEILSFRKDGTGVGHIGVDASTMYFNFGSTSAAAHQLDDYEEGSWTPSLNNAGTINYSHQIGRYTRIGRQVHFVAYVRWNSRSNNGSYNITYSGLPYNNANVSNLNPAIYVGGIEGLSGNNSSNTHMGGNVYNNNNTGQFRISNTTGGGEISLNGNYGSTGAGYIYWAGSYYVV